MQEVLSRTNDVSIPCEELEYYHLSLTEYAYDGEQRYRVLGFVEKWDPELARMACEYETNLSFESIEDAKESYTECRAAVVKRGFVYSDKDMF